MDFGALKTTLDGWAKRTDLQPVYSSIVDLAQQRLNRDLRLSGMVQNATLTTTAGVESVALPADWLIGLSVDLEGTALEYRTTEQLRGMYPPAYSGRPAVFSVEGRALVLGPVPDSTYSLRARYYKRFEAFSLDTDTDYVLTNHSAVYLAACMVEIAAYTRDDALAAFWEPRYQQAVAQVNKSDGSAGVAGVTLRMKAR